MDNIGVGLRNMEMIVYGNTGYSFGSNMQSGKLVLCNCLDHAASGMKGGEIFIHGNTGDYLRASLIVRMKVSLMVSFILKVTSGKTQYKGCVEEI